MAMALALPLSLFSCLDPGIDIKDVTDRCLGKEDSCDYATQQEFTLLKGKTLISGFHLIPTQYVEDFLREEKKSPLTSAPSAIERSFPPNSKFKTLAVTRLFDKWEDKTEDDASYVVEIELETGMRCCIDNITFRIDGKHLEFKPEFVKKLSNAKQ